MNTQETIDCGILIGAMCEVFGVEATDGLLRGYLFGLSDLTLEQIKESVKRVIRECDRLPKPAEMRRLAGEATDEQAAMIAWDDVYRALPLGSYKHVNFSNVLINAVVRSLGGWPAFISRFADAEAEKWVRLDFIRTYKNLANCVSDEACAPLAGLAEVVYQGNGVERASPVLIACNSQAKQRVGIESSPLVQRIS